MQFDVMNIPGMILDVTKAAPDDPIVNYRYSSDPSKCCGLCEHFEVPGSCELVSGVKRAVDVCDLFCPTPDHGMIYARLPEPVALPPSRDLPIGPAQTKIGPIQAILVPSPVQSELVSNAPQVQAEIVGSKMQASEGGPGSGPNSGEPHPHSGSTGEKKDEPPKYKPDPKIAKQMARMDRERARRIQDARNRLKKSSEGGPGSGPRPGQGNKWHPTTDDDRRLARNYSWSPTPKENPRQVDKDFAIGKNDIRTPFPNAAQRPPIGIFKKPSPRVAGPSVAGPRPVLTSNIRRTSEADRPKSFDLPPAREEMKTKSDVDIEVETAYKWGARSVACYEMFKETDDTKWLLKAEDYRHETLEHAALAKDGGKTLGAIEKMLDDAKGSTPEIESVR